MRKYALSQYSATFVRLVHLTFLKSLIRSFGMYANLHFRTDFWGPASNFGIPLAAVMDVRKDPEMCVLPFFFH